jgi:23S rRNA-/tRNA-specific pseudouridylate synthase
MMSHCHNLRRHGNLEKDWDNTADQRRALSVNHRQFPLQINYSSVSSGQNMHTSTSVDRHVEMSLSDEIRTAYHEGETDGILRLAASMRDASELVSASLEAAEGRKGEVASILNAWIGSCSLVDDPSVGASRASDFLKIYDELAEEKNISPDVVTFCLAYKALNRDERYREMAESVLDRAAHTSKKQAGSKRRKALAASRRKGLVICGDVEEELQSLCGSDFSVLHETHDFVVVNKPSGVSCYHNKATTAGKIRKKGKGQKGSISSDFSLEDSLLHCNISLSTLNPECLGLVHRLDRGTSGCMVLAKTEAMHANLVAEFFLRQSQKKYLTLVSPPPGLSLPEEGDIDLPVDGRPAKSKYRILQRYGTDAALLEVETLTGRKHQVRKHCAQGLQSPVVMDPMYSDIVYEGPLKTVMNIHNSKHYFFLHASKLSIPDYGINVESPLPSWWQVTIDSLGKE